jgi:hypothetical protein
MQLLKGNELVVMAAGAKEGRKEGNGKLRPLGVVDRRLWEE